MGSPLCVMGAYHHETPEGWWSGSPLHAVGAVGVGVPQNPLVRVEVGAALTDEREG